MAIDQAQFDTDLSALVAAIGQLEAAIDAWTAAQPAGVDLTTEDNEVLAASASVAAELAKITPAASGASTTGTSTTGSGTTTG